MRLRLWRLALLLRRRQRLARRAARAAQESTHPAPLRLRRQPPARPLRPGSARTRMTCTRRRRRGRTRRCSEGEAGSSTHKSKWRRTAGAGGTHRWNVPPVTATSSVCGSAPKATSERGAGEAAEAAAEEPAAAPPAPPAPGGSRYCACDQADEKYFGSNPFCKSKNKRGARVVVSSYWSRIAASCASSRTMNAALPAGGCCGCAAAAAAAAASTGAP